MAEMITSRLSGFHKLAVGDRLSTVSRLARMSPDETHAFTGSTGLTPELANTMIENAVGVFGIPLGLGLNLQVNGRDYLVPMAVEEPSVIAAVSFAAKIAREGGGFVAEADDPIMIGQVQVTGYGDPAEASKKLLAHKEQLLAVAKKGDAERAATALTALPFFQGAKTTPLEAGKGNRKRFTLTTNLAQKKGT